MIGRVDIHNKLGTLGDDIFTKNENFNNDAKNQKKSVTAKFNINCAAFGLVLVFAIIYELITHIEPTKENVVHVNVNMDKLISLVV